MRLWRWRWRWRRWLRQQKYGISKRANETMAKRNEMPFKHKNLNCQLQCKWLYYWTDWADTLLVLFYFFSFLFILPFAPTNAYYFIFHLFILYLFSRGDFFLFVDVWCAFVRMCNETVHLKRPYPRDIYLYTFIVPRNTNKSMIFIWNEVMSGLVPEK